MSDAKLPDNDSIQRAFETEPHRILDQFGDDYRKERAKENLRIAHGYVKELRERQKADH